MKLFSTQLLPFLFVAIYGSGFVGARLGLPHAEPFSFLALRFALAAAVLAVVSLIFRSRWPRNIGWLAISGLLLQGVFSVGVFYALWLGMKPAVAALIIALQPLCVTVLAGKLLAECVPKRHWFGLALGIIGVTVVVADGLATDGISGYSLSWAILGLLGLTFGQLLQKRHCADMELVTGGLVQALGSALVMWLLAYLFESREIHWNPEFITALAWMSIGVSIGALSLLYLMLRYQTASQVASVFYGVPVAAALVAWPLFDQLPTVVDWLGFTLVAVSVSIAYRSSAAPRSEPAGNGMTSEPSR